MTSKTRKLSLLGDTLVDPGQVGVIGGGLGDPGLGTNGFILTSDGQGGSFWAIGNRLGIGSVSEVIDVYDTSVSGPATEIIFSIDPEATYGKTLVVVCTNLTAESFELSPAQYLTLQLGNFAGGGTYTWYPFESSGYTVVSGQMYPVQTHLASPSALPISGYGSATEFGTSFIRMSATSTIINYSGSDDGGNVVINEGQAFQNTEGTGEFTSNGGFVSYNLNFFTVLKIALSGGASMVQGIVTVYAVSQ